MTRAVHRLRDAGVRRAARFTCVKQAEHGDVVLVIQPDHLGDILLSQPAIRAIRKQFPEHRVVGVVGPWSETIARMAWPVDDVVTVSFPAFARDGSSRGRLHPYRALQHASRMLGELNPGKAFVLRPDDWWSAWMASMSTGGPIVTARDTRMDPFASVQVDVEAFHHATEKAVAIAGGAVNSSLQDAEPLALEPDETAAIEARSLLTHLGIGERYIVIHPGSGADVKLWPEKRWNLVARQFAERGRNIVITGSPVESLMAGRIAASVSGAVSVAGKTPLPVLIEVLRNAELVAGPDCGPLHLAVACQTPTVHLFGPSDPGKFGPWGSPDRHKVISAGWSCSRCGDLSDSRSGGCGCMLAITVGQVKSAIQDALDKHASG